MGAGSSQSRGVRSITLRLADSCPLYTFVCAPYSVAYATPGIAQVKETESFPILRMTCRTPGPKLADDLSAIFLMQDGARGNAIACIVQLAKDQGFVEVRLGGIEEGAFEAAYS